MIVRISYDDESDITHFCASESRGVDRLYLRRPLVTATEQRPLQRVAIRRSSRTSEELLLWDVPEGTVSLKLKRI